MNKRMIDDANISSLKQLFSPIELMENIPLSKEAIKTISAARQKAQQIIRGEDDRLLVVVGPCSIHNHQSAVEYGELLKKTADELQDDLCIIMRVYFEKPRTTIGWKGLINDPKLDGSFDINHGLNIARQLLLDLNNNGVATATEFLDTIIPQYISDLISWGAIGARTTESQIHRELASGLSMPIGFKNGTNGDIDIALDAIRAASFPHHFLGITKSARAAIVSTKGNQDCHIILRGAKDHTNYDEQSIQSVAAKLERNGFSLSVMVDCSHGNSRKNHKNQSIVVDELSRQIAHGSTAITGTMIESHLTSGNQPCTLDQPLKYNQSVTDACISWEETVPLLEKLAKAVQSRRTQGGKR